MLDCVQIMLCFLELDLVRVEQTQQEFFVIMRRNEESFFNEVIEIAHLSAVDVEKLANHVKRFLRGNFSSIILDIGNLVIQKQHCTKQQNHHFQYYWVSLNYPNDIGIFAF